ncbi:sodium/proton antiporter NhaB [Bibersteinia trehalosi]|uniref:Na(+)/H(+) antiporter NhaB n=4 Tax=Bibersteinia trehalosi TaxID=47735 RepID=W0R4X9_BIBTR|nr:sodium/proton antiporter NhaB [Bibersteinia trehalosi]AGH37821.1 Na(+)/H(+) antiporter nhaB [Bibersteinia trehalosi USDA-ARS-USMARC-192]AHG84695.1 Na(+)/H(+) antiporter nhaB [Bibersteinia trehalosi USDA-ARS-USMARC-189]AHG85806.1 Na(+)/H(+) antiporter nhaB [Bibersteinia trehalosi USDA-ARS-USMARC-190]OAQ15644.1 sodium:proton antiporter [Bibersteinia trehalosi Y31]RRN00465.1 sodium/proton antiporter NhaB [Bibersteinia trehalosi]
MNSFQTIHKNFLGSTPSWYKSAILIFLILNPIIYFFISPFIAGWLLVAEFIFTLAMALKCYPLQPGGLLAIEAVAIGMTSPEHIKHEIMANFEVILLLMFMVAGIFFMKRLLLYVFTKLLLVIHSKKTLSLAFCLSAAFLSAFLDALTVIAVILSVGMGFYKVYHKVASGGGLEDVDNDDENISNDDNIKSHREILEQFRGFLRSLLMHAAVGSALGGVMTMVGEPQNLIIAAQANWGFGEFFLRVSPIGLLVLICGALTCYLLEKYRLFGYGDRLPRKVWIILAQYNLRKEKEMSPQIRMQLVFQAIAGIWLVIALAFHLAEVGLIGLSVIIFCSTFNGVTDEHSLGKAFQESMPFTALLVVFFSVVSVIVDLNLFEPIIHFVLTSEPNSQLAWFYIFNGVLSSISDNVFVGTVYINEAKTALENGTISREMFDLIAVAINTGTNLPSVATPNGQAAFLFLLTSSFAPLIRLSYGRMVYMALPYTAVLSIVGFLALEFLLQPLTQLMLDFGWIVTR